MQASAFQPQRVLQGGRAHCPQRAITVPSPTSTQQRLSPCKRALLQPNWVCKTALQRIASFLQDAIDISDEDDFSEEEEGEEEQEFEGTPVLPPDMARALYHLVSTVESQQDWLCTNCQTPLQDSSEGTCEVCGHSPAADHTLLGTPGQLWQQRLQEQQGSPAYSPSGARLSRAKKKTKGQGAPVALCFDERMLLHRASLPPYPERPERLAAILTRLDASGLLQRCQLLPARDATDDELHLVHAPSLVRAIQEAAAGAAAGPAGAADGPGWGPLAGTAAAPAAEAPAAAGAAPGAAAEAGLVSGEETWDSDDEGLLEPFEIRADTLVSAGTYAAARLAAGAAAALAEQLVQGQCGAGVAVIRPPGHQASSNTAQSGCYFNNAAVAAVVAQLAGAERVMILDWDVHHGQGTQEVFEDDSSVLYVSMHRAEEEFYPGTGLVTEVGSGEGEGFTVNIAWQNEDVGDADYMQAMMHIVLPMCYEFQPDLIIVSAGFSAVEGDPIGGCKVTPAGYAHMTHMLKGVAPVAMLLEGGYNLDATAACMEACVRVLLGERPPKLEGDWELTKTGAGAIMNAMQIQSEYWPSINTLSLNGWMTAIREQQEQATRNTVEELEEGMATGIIDADAAMQRLAAGGLLGSEDELAATVEGMDTMQALLKVTAGARPGSGSFLEEATPVQGMVGAARRSPSPGSSPAPGRGKTPT